MNTLLPIELDIQFAIDDPMLSPTIVQTWVNAAIQEVQLLFQEAGIDSPYQSAQLTLRFCDEKEGQQLNADYRGKEYATNVLTFEYGIDEAGQICADIIICAPVLHSEANEQNKPFIHHAAHLCVHGVLHALGYDHVEQADAEEMESLEIDILAKLAIPNPYSTHFS